MPPNASQSIDVARSRLRSIGRAKVRLGADEVRRGFFGIRRTPRIVPVATAWRLGVLLIGDEAVYAVGLVVRARAEAIRGFTAESQRERAALAAAAVRGGFDEGESVYLGWSEVDLTEVDAGGSSGPLAMYDGVACVRWSATGELRPLEEYLAEYLS